MPRSWPGFAAPLVAAVATLLLAWVEESTLAQAANAQDAVSPALVLGLVLGLMAPLVVPTLWGLATLASRPLVLVAAAAVAWLGAGLMLLPGEVVWPWAGFVLAGLAAGSALGFRWRLDVAVAVVVLALAPNFVWQLHQYPVDQQYRQWADQYLEARREMLTGTAEPKQVELTLEAERRQQEKLVAYSLKILPAFIGLGVAGLAGMLLSMVWLTARLLGVPARSPALPPFGRWRLPFYLVWALVAGLGLFITRQPYLAAGGLNIALAVVTLLSLQGAAVQWALTGRTMGLVPRVIYLLVAGFLFLPLVLLGLADQWLDFRKLEDSHGEGPPVP